jgi:hypothetical protein
LVPPAAGETFPEIFVTVKLFRFLLTPYSLIGTFKCAELNVLLTGRDGAARKLIYYLGEGF